MCVFVNGDFDGWGFHFVIITISDLVLVVVVVVVVCFSLLYLFRCVLKSSFLYFVNKMQSIILLAELSGRDEER